MDYIPLFIFHKSHKLIDPKQFTHKLNSKIL